MPAILDALLERKARSEREAQQSFLDIARRIANDDDPELREVTAAMSAAGKTEDDLVKLVAELKRRNALRRQVFEYRAAVAEKPDLEQKIAVANDELEVAKAKHRATVAPLNDRLRAIREMSIAASQAQTELKKQCPDPETSEQLETVRFDLSQTDRKIQETSALIDRQQSAIAANSAHGSDTTPMQSRMAEAKEQLASLREEFARLQDAERDILEAMIEV